MREKKPSSIHPPTHLSNGVMTAGVVVRRILLPADDLLGVVELAVGATSDLVADGGLQVDVHRARDVLAGAGLAEERVEGVVAPSDGLVGGHLAVRLDAVLEAVELPAAVAGLDTGLAHVDRDAFWDKYSISIREIKGWELGGMLLSSEGFVERGGCVMRHWFGSEIKVCHRLWIHGVGNAILSSPID